MGHWVGVPVEKTTACAGKLTKKTAIAARANVNPSTEIRNKFGEEGCINNSNIFAYTIANKGLVYHGEESL